MPNPLIGVLYHWLGGLASGSFYVPYKYIRHWSWEIFWLTGGLFSWLVAPWLFAGVGTADLLDVLRATPQSTLVWCWFWGVVWGFGGLTFGLTMRYLLGASASLSVMANCHNPFKLCQFARTICRCGYSGKGRVGSTSFAQRVIRVPSTGCQEEAAGQIEHVSTPIERMAIAFGM